jgi:hypothetical protein
LFDWGDRDEVDDAGQFAGNARMLEDDDVFKIKRPVALGFLAFSSIEARKAA